MRTWKYNIDRIINNNNHKNNNNNNITNNNYNNNNNKNNNNNNNNNKNNNNNTNNNSNNSNENSVLGLVPSPKSTASWNTEMHGTTLWIFDAFLHDWLYVHVQLHSHYDHVFILNTIHLWPPEIFSKKTSSFLPTTMQGQVYTWNLPRAKKETPNQGIVIRLGGTWNVSLLGIWAALLENARLKKITNL